MGRHKMCGLTNYLLVLLCWRRHGYIIGISQVLDLPDAKDILNIYPERPDLKQGIDLNVRSSILVL